MFSFYLVRDQNKVVTAFSNYFEVITPGTVAEQIQSVDDISAILNIFIQCLAILIGIVLVLLVALCFMNHYKTKNTGPGEEVISLRDSLRLVNGYSILLFFIFFM